MMAELTIEVNEAILQSQIDALQAAGKAAGLTMQHLFWEVAADSAKSMQKYTAPWANGGKPTNSKAAYNTGAGAIAYDLTWDGGARPSGVFSFLDGFKKYPDFENGYVGLKSPKGSFFAVPQDYILGTEADLERVHLSRRGKTGRVKLVLTPQSKTPRGRLVKMHHFAMRSTIQSYLKKVFRRVGTLKAGWNDSIRYFCGKVGKNTGITNWISRHQGSGGHDDTMKVTGEGRVAIKNMDKWAGAIRESEVLFVKKKAERDVKSHLEKRMEKIAERIAALNSNAEAVK